MKKLIKIIILTITYAGSLSSTFAETGKPIENLPIGTYTFNIEGGRSADDTLTVTNDNYVSFKGGFSNEIYLSGQLKNSKISNNLNSYLFLQGNNPNEILIASLDSNRGIRRDCYTNTQSDNHVCISRLLPTAQTSKEQPATTREQVIETTAWFPYYQAVNGDPTCSPFTQIPNQMIKMAKKDGKENMHSEINNAITFTYQNISRKHPKCFSPGVYQAVVNLQQNYRPGMIFPNAGGVANSREDAAVWDLYNKMTSFK